MYEPARRNAGYTLIAGLVLLAFGLLSQPAYLVEDQDFYNRSLSLFFGTLKAGGGVLLLVAVLSFAGLRIGLLLDAVTSGACGLVMILCSAYWVKFDGLDVSNALFIVFGILFVRAAFVSFSVFKGEAPSAGRPAIAAADAPASDPVHPASLHPDSLPNEGEPPPPEGYLAALSKDQGEPPDAAFK
jgi:hypothetical protein